MLRSPDGLEAKSQLNAMNRGGRPQMLRSPDGLEAKSQLNAMAHINALGRKDHEHPHADRKPVSGQNKITMAHAR